MEDFPRKGRQGVQGRPLALRFERGEAAHDIGDIAQQEAAVSQFFREAIGCLSLDRFDGTEGAVAQTMSPAFAKECRCLQLFINVPQKGSSAGSILAKAGRSTILSPRLIFSKAFKFPGGVYPHKNISSIKLFGPFSGLFFPVDDREPVSTSFVVAAEVLKEDFPFMISLLEGRAIGARPCDKDSNATLAFPAWMGVAAEQPGFRPSGPVGRSCLMVFGRLTHQDKEPIS